MKPKAIIHENGLGLEQIRNLLDVPEGGRWWSFDVHWFNGGGIVIGPGGHGGNFDVASTGHDFADAIANAVRFGQSMGRDVDGIGVNI